jgi:hypothetical protein
MEQSDSDTAVNCSDSVARSFSCHIGVPGETADMAFPLRTTKYQLIGLCHGFPMTKTLPRSRIFNHQVPGPRQMPVLLIRSRSQPVTAGVDLHSILFSPLGLLCGWTSMPLMNLLPLCTTSIWCRLPRPTRSAGSDPCSYPVGIVAAGRSVSGHV